MVLENQVAIDAESGPELAFVPERFGVVRLTFPAGRPYLARTVNLRRRLQRLLDPVRSPQVRSAVRDVSYTVCGSPFETSWTLYRAAWDDWPDDYRRRLRLRCPPFVRLILSNRFPRTTVTTRPGRGEAVDFGPFRSRAAAERFEAELLDFFGVRRCVENLEPDPRHPGCIYGEIGKCSRPCQAAVSDEEYRRESGRLLAALHTSGESLQQELSERREQASEALEFEEAARLHSLIEKLGRTRRLAEEPARDLDRLHGIIVQRAATDGVVRLQACYKGFLQPSLLFAWEAEAEKPTSLDRRLREALAEMPLGEGAAVEREDHQALLARWRFSNRRKGEMVLFDGWKRLPFRKLVHSVSRVARGRESHLRKPADSAPQF